MNPKSEIEEFWVVVMSRYDIELAKFHQQTKYDIDLYSELQDALNCPEHPISFSYLRLGLLLIRFAQLLLLYVLLLGFKLVKLGCQRFLMRTWSLAGFLTCALGGLKPKLAICTSKTVCWKDVRSDFYLLFLLRTLFISLIEGCANVVEIHWLGWNRCCSLRWIIILNLVNLARDIHLTFTLNLDSISSLKNLSVTLINHLKVAFNEKRPVIVSLSWPKCKRHNN